MIGLQVFKEHFQGYEDHYVIIGGTACTVLFSEIEENFRGTRDIIYLFMKVVIRKRSFIDSKNQKTNIIQK